MKLEQTFKVEAPIEKVWEALIDVERVAPCLPGAEITESDDSGTASAETPGWSPRQTTTASASSTSASPHASEADWPSAQRWHTTGSAPCRSTPLEDSSASAPSTTTSGRAPCARPSPDVLEQRTAVQLGQLLGPPKRDAAPAARTTPAITRASDDLVDAPAPLVAAAGRRSGRCAPPRPRP